MLDIELEGSQQHSAGTSHAEGKAQQHSVVDHGNGVWHSVSCHDHNSKDALQPGSLATLHLPDTNIHPNSKAPHLAAPISAAPIQPSTDQ